MKTRITFFDTVQVVGIADTEDEFVKKGEAVFRRFEIEIEAEDVFEYDPEESGYADELSLNEFLAKNGISLTPNQLVVIIEDEVLGTGIELIEVAEIVDVNV